MADTYLTIAAPSEGVFREKMSKFLAFAHPVTTLGEAKSIIASYQKKYFDARHVCWAYMLGFDRTDFQSNDNGEPSGTAGKPILGQINSFNLTDVVIVVVRYFGGIKLGTSGLIAAYREAARIALDEAEIVERKLMKQIQFTFPYLSMNDVMRTVKQCGLDIISQQFDNDCSMTVSVRADDYPAITTRLADIDGLSIR
ncbi:MAG: IMPACT family protein [Muribaculaceae bacterium]|nr:IMPACT family protein [Muribaculaceae bacterium]